MKEVKSWVEICREAEIQEADQIIRQIDVAKVCQEIDRAITYYWTGRDGYLDLQTRVDHLETAFNILENENYHTEAEKVAKVLWRGQHQLKTQRAKVAK